MALSRLFGKSKKPASSPTAERSVPGTSVNKPQPDPYISEDESFTMVGQPGNRNSSSFQGYPALPAAPATPAYPSATLASQASLTGTHALDGVPFVLSSRCAPGEGGGTALDEELRAVSAKLESVTALLASANYDFRQEKNVLEQDLTSSMSGLGM